MIWVPTLKRRPVWECRFEDVMQLSKAYTVSFKGFFFVLVSLVLLSGCSRNETKQESAQASDRARLRRARLLELGSRHNACSNWMESLPDRGFSGQFTLDVERALIRSNNQPISLEARVKDLAEQDGMLRAHFTASQIARTGSGETKGFRMPHLLLVLDCGPEQAKALREAKHDPIRMTWGVVATIDSVSCPVFRAVPVGSGEVFQMDFSSLPRLFIARGTCVDLALLESRPKR